VRFAFIAQMDAEKAFPIAFMCHMLQVSRPGFYAWRNRPPSTRARRDAELTAKITIIHTAHRGRVGVRRIRDELARAGVVCSHKRVHRLMRAARLKGVHPRPYKHTTVPDPTHGSVPDLVGRHWQPPAPDRIWVGDVTYIKTWSGWAYLATVIDCYSRRVVGWAVSTRLRADLVVDALRMAIVSRNPHDVIFHSDRGSQYTSQEFARFCRRHNVRRSVGRTGNCYDNAVAESFFATLKKELIHTHPWPSVDKLRAAVFEYIELYYNQRRRHSTIGYNTPAEHERTYTLTRLQAA
jgi:putative transposase